jgi:hypothetical protein
MGFFQALGESKADLSGGIMAIDTNNEAMVRSQQAGRIQAIEEQKQQIVLNEAKRKEEQLDKEVGIDHIIDYHKRNPSKAWDYTVETFGDKFQKKNGRTVMRVRDVDDMVMTISKSEQIQNKMLDFSIQDKVNMSMEIDKQLVSLQEKKAQGGDFNEEKYKELQAKRNQIDDDIYRANKFRVMSQGEKGQIAVMQDATKNTKAEYDLLFKQANLEQKEGALALKEKYLAIDAQYKQKQLDMTLETVKMRAESVNTAYQNMLIAKDNQSIGALNSIAKVHDQAIGRQIQALAKADATPEQKQAIGKIGQAESTSMMLAMLARPDIGGKLSIEQKTDIGLKVEFATRAYEEQWKKITGMSFDSTPPVSDKRAWVYIINKWTSVPGMTGDAITKKIANSLRISEKEALDFYREIYALRKNNG